MLFIEKIIINENLTTLCVDNQGIKLNIYDKKMEYIKNINCKNCEEHMIKYNTLLYVLVTTISTCMDIWQDLLPYNIRDMCNSMTNQMNVHLNSYGIKTELTAQGWYFFYDNKPITFEEVIRKLPDDISFQEYKTDSKLHMSNAVWKYEMSILDTMFNVSTQHDNFYSYVKNMTKNELIQNIKNEYFDIKGNSGKTPHMGQYGSFEFAGALLLWNYVKMNLNSSEGNSYGEVMITLGETIGCAFFGMPAGEWSDKIDVVINSANDIISYPEWSDIYNYLKNNYSNEIHAMEFNRGTYSEGQQNLIYNEFIKRYNRLTDYNSVLDYYTQQNLNIKCHMKFKILN